MTSLFLEPPDYFCSLFKPGLAFCKFGMLFAEGSLEDLAAGVLGQGVGEDDVLGPLVAGELALARGRGRASAVSDAPGLGTTTAVTASIQCGWLIPNTATSATPSSS